MLEWDQDDFVVFLNKTRTSVSSSCVNSFSTVLSGDIDGVIGQEIVHGF